MKGYQYLKFYKGQTESMIRSMKSPLTIRFGRLLVHLTALFHNIYDSHLSGYEFLFLSFSFCRSSRLIPFTSLDEYLLEMVDDDISVLKKILQMDQDELFVFLHKIVDKIVDRIIADEIVCRYVHIFVRYEIKYEIFFVLFSGVDARSRQKFETLMEDVCVNLQKDGDIFLDRFRQRKKAKLLIEGVDGMSNFPLEFYTYYPDVDWALFACAVKNQTRQSDYPLLWDLVDADDSLWLLPYLPSYAQIASLLFSKCG